jgi:hypothetical protein
MSSDDTVIEVSAEFMDKLVEILPPYLRYTDSSFDLENLCIWFPGARVKLVVRDQDTEDICTNA